MSRNLNDEPQPLKVGDCVVLMEHVPGSKLNNGSGKIRAITDDGLYAMVEFLAQPKKMHKMFLEDLELLFDEENGTETQYDGISFHDIAVQDDHDLGGMSPAQLIAHKLFAQEIDPGLDRSIGNLIN